MYNFTLVNFYLITIHYTLSMNKMYSWNSFNKPQFYDSLADLSLVRPSRRSRPCPRYRVCVGRRRDSGANSPSSLSNWRATGVAATSSWCSDARTTPRWWASCGGSGKGWGRGTPTGYAPSPCPTPASRRPARPPPCSTRCGRWLTATSTRSGSTPARTRRPACRPLCWPTSVSRSRPAANAKLPPRQ